MLISVEKKDLHLGLRYGLHGSHCPIVVAYVASLYYNLNQNQKKKFISFKKNKKLTFRSMHAVSEMAVAINCFCVVMGVAIMLLAVC